ncbi:putative histidine phosphatase superfamily, clade-1 [Helianthus annuus]|nr:putative histidine phosphatase superfamily, clade-1 [Helianthus annuus]
MVTVVCSSGGSSCMSATSTFKNKAGSGSGGFRSQPLVMETAQVPPRRLILLRHAKSSWEDRSLKDGETDVIQVTYKLQKLGWIPQLILSSDATRTRQTLKIMQDQVRAFLEAEIHFISSFYSVAAMDGQTADHLRRAICKYARDEILTVM